MLVSSGSASSFVTGCALYSRSSVWGQYTLALLLATFFVDVPSQFIDYFSLPVPSRVAGLPVSMLLAMISAMLMWPQVKSRRRHPLVSPWEFVALCLFLLAILVSILRSASLTAEDVYYLLSYVPLWLAAVLTRQYHGIYGRIDGLVAVYVWVVSAVCVLQILLLMLPGIGVVVPWVNLSEVRDRNGLGALLGMALWLRLTGGYGVSRLERVQLLLLILLAVIVLLLNDSRGGFVVFGVVLFYALLNYFDMRPWWLRLVSINLIVLAVLVAVFSYPLLEAAGQFSLMGSGDAELSTIYRSKTNWLLLQELQTSPWLGLGVRGAFSVRAGGYISHTLFILAVSIFGAIVSLAVLALVVRRCVACERARRPVVFGALSIIVVNMVFVNDPLPVYGFVLIVALSFGCQARLARVGL